MIRLCLFTLYSGSPSFIGCAGLGKVLEGETGEGEEAEPGGEGWGKRSEGRVGSYRGSRVACLQVFRWGGG